MQSSGRNLTGWSVALCGLAALSLGLGINRRDGLYSQGAIFWLNVAVACAILILIGLRLGRERWTTFLPHIVLIVALVVQFVALYRHYPGTLWNTRSGEPRNELSIKRDALTWIGDREKLAAAKQEVRRLEDRLVDGRFRGGVLVAVGLAALTILPNRWIRLLGLLGVLAVHFALGAWLIHRTPDPFIDVHVFQQESCAALLRGHNPYATTFTNIYGEGAYVYAPDLMKNGHVNFGYPYMPLSLFMALPGYLIAGDHRYSQLAALTVAGLLLALCRPGMLASMAALVLLFTPRVFMVVEMAWTEPFVAALLALTVFCACRYPRWTPYALGLLLASKQYTIFVVPLAALLLIRPFRWRDYLMVMLKAGAVAAVVSLPLVLWDIKAFFWSAVKLQLIQPFRTDAISYLAWFAWNISGNFAPKLSVLAFVAAAVAVVLVLWRCPRSAAGFAAGVAIVYLAFLAFNKQAFCNYYFFVISAFCAAAAAGGVPVDRRSHASYL